MTVRSAGGRTQTDLDEFLVFLLYTGGLTVLGAAVAALAYLSGQYGKGAFVAWTLLPLVVLYAVAFSFRKRGEWIAAGIFTVAG